VFFRQLREIFIFSGRERNGILLLLFLLLFVLSADLLLPLIWKEPVCDTTAWREKAEAYFAGIASAGDSAKAQFSGKIDPNQVKVSMLLQMGIPKVLALHWVRYLEKGGHFKKREDLLKLYGMTPEKFEALKEHLVFSAPQDSTPQHSVPFVKPVEAAAPLRRDTLRSRPVQRRKMEVVEVNKADSAQLEALPGIGPTLASRIIKYRRLLGGYHDVPQIRKVYGMSEELWQRSSPHLTVDSAGISKIGINFLSLNELAHHPYIGFKYAKKIIKMRDTVGKFTSVEELATIFSPDSLHQLRPYLSLTATEK